jgi:peptidoglycan-N-acetylglucosamine deacetylase
MTTVCLTFDNGPTPGVTEAVLDVLAAHDVAATFFAIGRKLDTAAGRRLGRRIVDAGHRLGGHTYSHAIQFGVADDAVVAEELARTRTAVEAAGGDGLLFRPYGAGGVIDSRLMSASAAGSLCDHGYTCVLWNVVPGDWRDQSGWVDGAIAGISSTPEPVVVLHDIDDAALPHLAEFFERAGDDVTWTQQLPEACTPIRDGVPTASFDLLFGRG